MGRGAWVGALGGLAVGVVSIALQVLVGGPPSVPPPPGGAPSAGPEGAGCASTVAAEAERLQGLRVVSAEWERSLGALGGRGLQPKGFASLAAATGDAPPRGHVVKDNTSAVLEVTAYHVDAALGLCHVPPTAGYAFDPKAAKGAPKGPKSVQAFWDGVRLLQGQRRALDFGAFRPCKHKKGKRAGHTISLCPEPEGEANRDKRCPPDAVADCTTTAQLLELSVVAVFDYIMCNSDRWRYPHNCATCTELNNLHSVGPARDDGSLRLIHLDHNFALPGECKPHDVDHLKSFCIFPAALVERLREFAPAGHIEWLRHKYWGGPLRRYVLESLAGDAVFAAQPGWMALADKRLEGVDQRLTAVLDHVDSCVVEYTRRKVIHEYDYANAAAA